MSDAAAPAGLRKSRVWISLNRNTLGLAALLFAMWYAGASQNNGAAYLLCFIIGNVALISTVHSWANLRGLEIQAARIPPAFAGEKINLPLTATCPGNRGHFGIRVRNRSADALTVLGDVLPENPVRAELEILTDRRGCFHTIKLQLSSIFPLGFFTAEKTIELHQTYYVYPKPEGNLPLPQSISAGRERKEGLRTEGEDFAGVRAYRRGESQRHIDWKAVARGQPMLVKQWAGDADETLHFQWNDLPQLSLEARLSQLAAWVLVAQRRGARYSLEIPGAKIPVSSGEAHQQQCLEALAAFELPSLT